MSDLRVNLTVETAKYRTILVQYEVCVDLHYQYTGRSVRDHHAEDVIYELASQAQHKMTETLARVRDMENTIKALQPEFRSAITQINFPRIGR